MMANRKRSRFVPSAPKATMILPTVSAVAIWKEEIRGQLSDGMWENEPFEHFRVWCNAEVKHEQSVSRFMCEGYVEKTNYNLRRLFDLGADCEFRYDIRDRMVNKGRMALALESLSRPFEHNAVRGAEYMPATLGEWATCKASGVWPNDGSPTKFIKEYMDHVDMVLAASYYQHMSYGIKQMKEDVNSIKAAMVSAKKSCF